MHIGILWIDIFLNKMIIYDINIPEFSLSNLNLIHYAQELNIPNFRGVFMRDTLPKNPRMKECVIVNLNTSKQKGSHWVAYWKSGKKRIYFDSFGQITPVEIQKYLKTKHEFNKNTLCIKRNTDIVQAENTCICGHLCLYVLKSLADGKNFQDTLNTLQHYNV